MHPSIGCDNGDNLMNLSNEDYESCDWNWDCKSALCEDGKCTPTDKTCVSYGDACTTDEECCPNTVNTYMTRMCSKDSST